MKIGFAQFSLASAFVLGPYVGAVGRSTTGTIIRITTDPKMLASASSFGLVVNKYALMLLTSYMVPLLEML
ncbi:MAG: hypothetical protein KGZ74_19825 [Chitinophagaceae bacterium]|nr:hypothetical protein [Chitinophagaceae bacterium]